MLGALGWNTVVPPLLGILGRPLARSADGPPVYLDDGIAHTRCDGRLPRRVEQDTEIMTPATQAVRETNLVVEDDANWT